MTTPKQLTNKEVEELVQKLAAPTFRYMMRRINKMLLNPALEDYSVNSLITVLIVSLATIDANGLRWIEKYYKMKIGKDIDWNKLKEIHSINLREQLDIKIH